MAMRKIVRKQKQEAEKKIEIQDDYFPPDGLFFDEQFPPWFIFVWGFLRAYCNQKIALGKNVDGYDRDFPEARLLERVAKMIEDGVEENFNPAKFVPKTLREIASYIREQKVNGNVFPENFIRYKNNTLFIRRVDLLSDLLSIPTDLHEVKK